MYIFDNEVNRQKLRARLETPLAREEQKQLVPLWMSSRDTSLFLPRTRAEIQQWCEFKARFYVQWIHSQFKEISHQAEWTLVAFRAEEETKTHAKTATVGD